MSTVPQYSVPLTGCSLGATGDLWKTHLGNCDGGRVNSAYLGSKPQTQIGIEIGVSSSVWNLGHLPAGTRFCFTILVLKRAASDVLLFSFVCRTSTGSDRDHHAGTLR